MFGLSFLITFKTNISNAVSGIDKLNTSMNYLKQTQAALNESMKKIFDPSTVAGAKIMGDAFATLQNRYDKMGLSANELQRVFDATFAEAGDLTRNILDQLIKLNPEFEDSAEKTKALRQQIIKLAAAGDMKSIRNLENNIKELGETMDKLGPKEVLKFQEQIKNLDKSIEKGDTSIKKMNDSLEKTNKRFKDADRSGGSFSNTIRDMWGRAQNAIGLTSAIVILTDALRNQDMMASTVAYSGLGNLQFAYSETGRTIERTGKSLDTLSEKMASNRNTTIMLSDVVGKMATSTSSSLTEATETMNQMFAMRVVNRDNINDLEEIGTTALNMEHAFGMSAGQAAEFGKSIMVIGGAGKKGFQMAGDALADVTGRMGLFPEDIQLVASQVGVMTRQFRAFGNTDGDVGKVVEGVGELAATFRNVGLEANDAMAILNNLLDPSKISDNAVLWHGLGLTAAEGMNMMMQGGKGLENVNERMVGLAKNLKRDFGHNIIALDSMAKVYGLTAQQVYSLSDATRALSEDELANKKLADQAAEARASMAKQLQQLWNQISVSVHELLVPLMTQLAPLAEKLVKWLTVFATKLNEGSVSFDPWIRKISKIGKIFRAGVFLSILGVIPVLKIVTGLFKGLGGVVGGVLGKVGGFFSKFGKMGGSKGGGGILGSILPDPKKAAAMALLIVAIGGAIFLAATGIAKLAEAMKGLSPEEFQMLSKVLIGMSIGIAIFAVGLIFLGKAAEKAAFGLLIVSLVLVSIGAMFLMIGIGIKFAAEGIATLVGAISGANLEGKGKEFLLIALGIAAIVSAAVIGGSAGAVALLALGAAALLASIGIQKMGTGLMQMGQGLDLIQLHAMAAGDALKYFFDQFRGSEQLFSKDTMKQLKDMSKYIQGIGTVSMMFGGTVGDIGGGGGATPQSDKDSLIGGAGDIVQSINDLGGKGVLNEIKKAIEGTNELLNRVTTKSGRVQVELSPV